MPPREREFFTPDEPTYNSGGAELGGGDAGAPAVTMPDGASGDAGGGASPDTANGVAVTPQQQATQSGAARPMSDLSSLFEREIDLDVGKPFVALIRATSIKLVRADDPDAVIRVRLNHGPKLIIDLGSFFAPGGVFEAIDLEADRPVKIVAQFGARFSG
jgi:hypothetical protein